MTGRSKRKDYKKQEKKLKREADSGIPRNKNEENKANLSNNTLA